MRKIKRLEDLVKKAERDGNAEKQMDLLLDLGNEHKADGNKEAAILQFKECLNMARARGDKFNRCLASRAIAEVSADMDNLTEAEKYAKEYRDTARQSDWPSEIQLSLHTSGYVYQVVAAIRKEGDEFVNLTRKGIDWAEQSFRYIRDNRQLIDESKEDVDRGGDSVTRQANLHSMLALLYGQISEKERATRHAQAAFNSAGKRKEYDVMFSALLNQFDWPWSNKMELAKQMGQAAVHLKAKEKALARFHCVKALLYYKGDLKEAQRVCYELIVHVKELGDDQREAQKTIVAVWRLRNCIEAAAAMEATMPIKAGKYYEKIGDYLTGLRILPLATKYYAKFLEYAPRGPRKMEAYESLAASYLDAAKYAQQEEERAKFVRAGQEVCARWLAELGKEGGETDSARGTRYQLDLLTGISIGEARLKLEQLKPISEKEMENARDAFASRFEGGPPASDDELDTEECECGECPLDSPDAETMWKSILDEAAVYARREKQDPRGETEMHKAARDADVDTLRKLIGWGCNVDKQDNAGWTPLHEAANVEIVRILLDAGAKVDPMARDSLSDQMTGGNNTPLMSACYYGHLETIELLLQRGASVTKRNEKGWTAVDFLKKALKSPELPASGNEERARKLIERMEQAQRKDAFFPPMPTAGYSASNPAPIDLTSSSQMPARKAVSGRGKQSQISTMASQRSCRSTQRSAPIRKPAATRERAGDKFVVPRVTSSDDDDENRCPTTQTGPRTSTQQTHDPDFEAFVERRGGRSRFSLPSSSHHDTSRTSERTLQSAKSITTRPSRISPPPRLHKRSHPGDVALDEGVGMDTERLLYGRLDDQPLNLSLRGPKRALLIDSSESEESPPIQPDDDLLMMDFGRPDEQQSFMAAGSMSPYSTVTETSRVSIRSSVEPSHPPLLPSTSSPATTTTTTANTSLNTSSTLTMPTFDSKTRKMTLTVEYEHENGTPLLNKAGEPMRHMIALDRDTRIDALAEHEKIKEVVTAAGGYSWHHRDGECDGELSLEQLEGHENAMKLKCRLAAISIEAWYRRRARATHEDVETLLQSIRMTGRFEGGKGIALNSQMLFHIDGALREFSLGCPAYSLPNAISLRGAGLIDAAAERRREADGGGDNQDVTTFEKWLDRLVTTRELRLSACRLDDVHLERMATMAAKNSHWALETLCLDFNVFTDGTHLRSLLAHTRGLRHLDLSGVELSEGLEDVFDAITQLDELRTLVLSGCRWVDGPRLQLLVERCPELHTLTAQGTAVAELCIDLGTAPSLRLLDISACRLTREAVESTLEWASTSEVENVNVGGSPVGLATLRRVVDSRRGMGPRLSLGLVGCAFYDEQLRDIPLDELGDVFSGLCDETGDDSVRFRLSTRLTRLIADKDGSVAEQLLCTL